MNDLISRKAVIKYLEEVAGCLTDDEQPFMACLITEVRRAPSAQRTGKWIDTHETEEWYGELYECSACGSRLIETDNYCPHCGCRMVEE